MGFGSEIAPIRGISNVKGSIWGVSRGVSSLSKGISSFYVTYFTGMMGYFYGFNS